MDFIFIFFHKYPIRLVSADCGKYIVNKTLRRKVA